MALSYSNDAYLSNQYKTMFGLNNLYNNILNLTTVNSSLYVSNISILNYVSTNNIIINQNCNANNITINNKLVGMNCTSNNISFYSNLTITTNTIFNKLNCNDIIINNNASANSISTNCITSNTIMMTNITTSNILLLSPTINIGNSNSIINIKGTLLSILSSELELLNKTIAINYNTNLSKYNAGIEIYNHTSLGYIRTSTLEDRYEIKPNNGLSSYILAYDKFFNIFVSGVSILYNNVSTLSSLYISNTSIFNSDTYINNINILGTSIINFINITSTCNINNNFYSDTLNTTNITCNNYISRSDITCNNFISSNLNTNSLYVNYITTNDSHRIICNRLNIGASSNFNNIISNNCSILTLQTNNIILTSCSILLNCYVNNTCTIVNNTTSTSNIYNNGNCCIYGNTTIKSNIENFNTLIMPLLDFEDNLSATNGGIPIYGLYRTGDVVKIRLSDIAPEITLNGLSIINISTNTIFTDPGVNIINNINNLNITCYIVSVFDGTTEYITNRIMISNTSLQISQSIIPTNTQTTYTIVYRAYDTVGNQAAIYAQRILNIV